MKRFLILCVLVMSLWSCSTDEGDNFRFEVLPVKSVEMPETFVFGETYDIRLTYLRPTSCHVFYDYYYESVGNQRTVAIVTAVKENDTCKEANTEREVSFKFKVISTDTYVFKFWQGDDSDGEDQYYIIEVPVTQ